MTAQILTFTSPLHRLATDLRPLFESAEAMLAQAETDAASGTPSLSEAQCQAIAQDGSLQAYALCDRLGLCPLVDMVPFWMRVAVEFPRLADGITRVWEREMTAVVAAE